MCIYVYKNFASLVLNPGSATVCVCVCVCVSLSLSIYIYIYISISIKQTRQWLFGQSTINKVHIHDLMCNVFILNEKKNVNTMDLFLKKIINISSENIKRRWLYPSFQTH